MTEAPSREPAAPPATLRRSNEGRFLMGVCAGLGRHTGVDPVVFRVGFAVLMFGSGIGFILYIAAFMLMKEPNGKPAIIEQWTRRDFDADTVLALLTAVLALGLVLNLSTVWLGAGTLVVGLFLAIALLAAHTSGVDLLALARSMPERLNRRPRPDGLATSDDFPRPAAAAPPADAPSVKSAPAAEAARAEEDVPSEQESPAAETVRADLPEETAAPVAAAPESAPAEEAREERAANTEERRARRDPEARRLLEDEAPFAKTAAYAVPTAARPRAEHPTTDPGRRTAAHPAYGEPFAPHGPYESRYGSYQPLDPARRGGGYSPYDPALYRRPVPRERRPKSYIGAITMALATIIGGILVAVQAASPSGVQPTLVAGAVLVTIGAGLLIAAWWGRGAGLVAAGTLVTLLIGVGMMFGGLPAKVGESVWHVTNPAESNRVYDAGVGDGKLDLSELRLEPGAKVTFDASIAVGELAVVVPPTARVEVHAFNRIGDIKVDQSLRGGVDVQFDKVLEPEVEPEGKAPTIVLNLKGGVGDLEVRRGA
ncbi:PspC domain-containing protein [Nonomuraea ceibae]|uniref:PspC domain-containing protein n=1 Tax=Nonomuraea ceibae TaxID=1935170 RepID=UPI001C5EBED0|nr:PspC domain-containing protein [Nonomuraea ceibae]